MHVLCLIDSLVMSGAEKSLAGLVPTYMARGVTVDVAYLRERPGLQSELRASGANLFSLDGRGARLGWFVRARRLISHRRPDLVHTTLFEADLAGRVAGMTTATPVVSTLTGIRYGALHRGNPSLRSWKVRAAQVADVATARRVVRYHALTSHVADEMSQRLRIPRHRIDVIPRGRDPEELGTRAPERAERARRRIGLSNNDRVVLAVARHDYKKGLDLLLQAFASVLRDIPEAKLVVAGRDGDQTSVLRAMAAQLASDGAVRFLGPRRDVPDLLCMADALVVPSRSEGFGGVLLEAMALEAPIVASDIPAVREVLGDEDTGLLVPAGDLGALSAAICSSLVDLGSAMDRSRRARNRFLAHFTIDQTADQMLEFYKRALAAA